MPIHTDLRTDALMAQYRTQRAPTRDVQASTPPKTAPTKAEIGDRLEISISANLTVETANGIMFDSVVEQINKALQEAGIDLKVDDETAGKIDTSPEGTARRIVDFATGFIDRFRQNHIGEDPGEQIRGFMSLTRNAIEEGFQHARDFLDGITKLSETIQKDIEQTQSLSNQFLDAFQAEQMASLAPIDPPIVEVTGAT
ncbi:MAG: DUF5610 domain-containing protein [bacterium]|jgi:hypothetical protein|nr:DUF5610 domain-containing protein [bacterium]